MGLTEEFGLTGLTQELGENILGLEFFPPEGSKEGKLGFWPGDLWIICDFEGFTISAGRWLITAGTALFLDFKGRLPSKAGGSEVESGVLYDMVSGVFLACGF